MLRESNHKKRRKIGDLATSKFPQPHAVEI